MTNNKRLLIYFLYNSSGHLPSYVQYQLEKFQEFCSYILVVSNGRLNPIAKSKLLEIVDEVLERENVGLDVGAFRAGIRHVGIERLNEFSETLLVNFTCFGPIFPLNELFAWSQKQNCDFWSLTKDNKPTTSEKYLHYNSCPFHYQSNFLALRRKFITSLVFQNFLNEMPADISYRESGLFFEYAFPGYFINKGFSGRVYCDDEDLEYPLLHNPLMLIQKYRLPFFKVRSFFHFYTDTLNHDAGLANLFLMDYIKNHTSYPENFIWDYILAEKNLAEIVTACQFFFTLSKSQSYATQNSLKIGCVFHAYFPDLFDEITNYLNYVKNVGIDILVTTTSDESKKLLLNILNKKNITATVKTIENRGRDVSALLVGASEFISNYDLVLFAHDKKSSQYSTESVGRVWRTKLFENTMGSESYIKNVIDLFVNNPQLGLAFPPYPRHSDFAEILTDGWTGNFSNTQKLLQFLGIEVKMSDHLRCIAPLGTCFWFRPRALEPLFKGFNGNGWEYSDFPAEPNKTDNTILHAIERCYCYVAQSKGYYPAFVQNDFMARNECTNLEFNQTSFARNRYWVNRLTAESTGQSLPLLDSQFFNDELSIKRNLKLLSNSVRLKYPRTWALAFPLRKLVKFLLKIRKK